MSLIEKKILTKVWSNDRKFPWAESQICEFVYEKENNSFEITVINFKAHKKCKTHMQKGF